MPTVEEKALESLLDLELRIEDDETKADGEGVVGRATSEESADCMESGVVGFLGLLRREMGYCSLSVACGLPAFEFWRRWGSHGCVHRNLSLRAVTVVQHNAQPP